MIAQQLSIFLENQPGRLAEVIGVLARAGINIRALSLADTSEFGVLRLLTDKPMEARAALREQGFQAKITEVAAVEVPDKPGSLSRVLDAFHAADVNVEYMYAFVGRPQKGAIMIFRLSDPEKAAKALTPDIGRLVPAEVLMQP
jgi:hypothetical protein